MLGPCQTLFGHGTEVHIVHLDADHADHMDGAGWKDVLHVVVVVDGVADDVVAGVVVDFDTVDILHKCLLGFDVGQSLEGSVVADKSFLIASGTASQSRTGHPQERSYSWQKLTGAG